MAGAGSYLVLAIAAASFVDVALRSPFAKMVTRDSWLVYLGKISFGLYVYHLLAISIARRWLHAYWRPLSPNDVPEDSMLLFAGALCLTVAFAAASYHFVERRIEKAKQRFTVVSGRPV